MAGFTYTTLKQAIQDYTENDEATFVSQLDTFIKNAEERVLKEVNLSEFRKNASANLLSGYKYIPKPADWLSTFSVSITVSGAHKFLLNKDVSLIQDYSPVPSTTGEPKYYANFDVDNFIVAPTPDAAYAVELHYFHRPASLTDTVSNPTGVTWLGTNASQALLYAALSDAYIFMKGEPDLIQTYEGRFAEAIQHLNEFSIRKEPSDVYRSGART